MSNRIRVVAFDLDAASLASFRDTLPEGEIEVIHGATAACLSGTWDPASADFLVVQASANIAQTIGLCRFLTFCKSFTKEFRGKGSNGSSAAWLGAPLLVLIPSGQACLVKRMLDGGANYCLVLPIHGREVAGVLARMGKGIHPGRHTVGLAHCQSEDLWRDEGGEG